MASCRERGRNYNHRGFAIIPNVIITKRRSEMIAMALIIIFEREEKEKERGRIHRIFSREGGIIKKNVISRIRLLII